MNQFPSIAELCKANKNLDIVTAESFNERMIVTLTNGWKISYPEPDVEGVRHYLTSSRTPRRASRRPAPRRHFLPWPIWRVSLFAGKEGPRVRMIYVQALKEMEARLKGAKRLNVDPLTLEVLEV